MRTHCGFFFFSADFRIIILSMKPLRLLLLLLLMSQAGQLLAQTGLRRISGQILDESRKSLPAATVTLFDTRNKAVAKTQADADGRFTLVHSEKGQYILSVLYIGYTEYRSAPFQLVDKDFGVISLSPAANSLNEIVVQAKQNPIELEGGNIVYNISKSIDAQGLNALDVLKRAPGVSVDNESIITLNGKQGALVMLDGRQTFLSGKELADLLRTLPSSAIRSIEIINSPTAKYDAAGSAGIINIRTSKSQVRGFNGTASTGLSYGMKLRNNTDASFNYRNNKINLYGTYGHFVGHYAYLYGSDRVQQGTAYNSDTDDTDKRGRIGGRIGLDYTLNAKHTLGLLLSSNFLLGGGITDTRTAIGQPAGPITQQLDAINDYYYQRTGRYAGNLNYKYEDSLGRMFNIDADYGFFEKDNSNLQSNRYTDPAGGLINDNLYRTFNRISINLGGLKADYSAKLWGGTLETGAKYSAIAAGNGSRFFHVLAAADSLDDRRTNTFDFNERIGAAYLGYKRTIGKWSLQAGLRLENSASDGTLYFRNNGVASTQDIRRNYTNLFPSFSAAIKPGANHSVSLAYSRRIDRPAYQDLNPFEYLLDELSFWKGNPFLQAQLTHRMSVQYAYKSATILSLTMAHTDNFSAAITDTLENSKIVMVSRNLGVQNNYSLALTQQVSPVKGWDITINGLFYRIHNKIAFDQYRSLNLKQLAGRLGIQQQIKLPWNLTGEVSSTLTSRRLGGANTISRGISQVDLGMQRQFMDKRATLRLVFNDIYKGNQTRSIQNVEGLAMNNYGYYESRQVRLNFSYKFADSSVKGPRNRNSGLESEQGRIK